jgi:hypothetical protein
MLVKLAEMLLAVLVETSPLRKEEREERSDE